MWGAKGAKVLPKALSEAKVRGTREPGVGLVALCEALELEASNGGNGHGRG